jgi:hypothetical protein
MSETKLETPKYELKAVWVSGFSVYRAGENDTTSKVAEIEKLLIEGWRGDPVLMPTGRPNIVEGRGAIYHLIKLPADPDEALKALTKYSDSHPTRAWNYLMGVNDLMHKMEMGRKQIEIASEYPILATESEDVILSTQYVENDAEKQKPWTDKGYFVAHKDHIGAKGTTFSLMGKRPKPQEPAKPSEPAPQPQIP